MYMPDSTPFTINYLYYNWSIYIALPRLIFNRTDAIKVESNHKGWSRTTGATTNINDHTI